MDLERIKKRNALFDRGAKLIEQARKLDVEGNYVDALPTYTEAIETLFQTLQCGSNTRSDVSDGEDKKQLRTLIEQFLSRAEEIKAVFAQQQEMLQHYQQQRTSVDLTASTLQQLQLDNRGSVNMGNNNSSNASNSEVMSAVQQLETIQVPAELPNKKVLGRLARTSVALPGTSQSMTPVNVMPTTTQSMTPVNVTPNNSALPGQVSHNSPYSPAANNNNYHAANNYGVNNNSITNGVGNNYGAHSYNVNNHSATNNYTPDHSYQVPNTNPWASAVTSPTHHYATQQLNSPYHNTASNNTYNNTSAYNNVSPYTPASPHTPNPYHNNTSAAYGTPASPYTAPYTSPTQQHYTSPRTSQHYSSPISGSYSPYNPTPYIPAPYSPAPSVDQYGNPYPRLYPSDAHSTVPQPQYHSAAQPYSPHSTQSYYDPHQNYTMQHSAYPDSCYTPQPNNPWGNYATSSCDPCDPCTGNYQYTQGMPPMNVSVTPVNVSQVQYSPVMSNTAVQSWPQHYTTQFTDLNQFINTNNLTAAVPQPDKDREKIILYFVSKGFQRQHVESSYDYLRKMNLQVNADFVEILKDALLVYPTTGTAGTAGTTSGTATPAPSALPSNLLSEVNTVPRPQWVSDDKAPQCKICSTPFTLLFRRHHCRGCGNVVCALCSDKEVPLPKLGYIHPVRVCKNCYENRELVEIKTTGDSSAVKVAAANFTKSVSDGLSKGTDFLYTQFFSAVARSTALTPAEITEIARSTQLSESEVSAHHLTFQEYKSPTGEYELHSYRYVLGPFGYSQPVNGPDVVEWLYATLHHSFYQGTSTEPKGVPFNDYIATMGTLLRGSEESRARLGYLTVYIADQLSQTPRDQRRITAPSYVLDKRKYPRRETARLPQSVPLNDMRVSVDHVTAVLFGVVEWLRALKINMDRRHERIEAALALLQPITAPITYQLYMRDKLYIKLVHALLYGKSRAAPRNTSAPGGHVVFPGHPHFNVMLSLMFAMQLAVDSAETNRPIVSSDFSEKRSDQTPYWPATNPLQLAADQNGDPVAPFTFYNVKIFTPTVWRAIRNKFGISETDLISSIGLEGMIWPWLLAGEWHGWSQQGSYGKSGSMFFYSSDGQFLLKTISASEAETLREMLAKYYDHVTTGPTLLTPFLGLVQLKDNKSKEHHFLVMRSVFTTAQQITCSYDLKGSVAGRITAEKDRKPGAPMKDLDFDRVIELHPALHQRLISTLTRDAKFLEAQGVMDYSLLLGITRQSPQSRDVQLSDGGWPAVSGEEVYYMGIIDYLVKFTAIKLLESTFKSFKYARHEISALPPNEYAERFLTFMQSIFKVR